MNTNENVKSNVINNIMLQMSVYLTAVNLDILQRVVEEQLVFVNMEEITTLPATVEESAEEQNNYLTQLFRIKKKNLAKETMEQYMSAVKRLVTMIDKPLIKMDAVDIDFYLRYYEERHIREDGKKNQASTCNNERRYLSAFFTWLRKERFITFNPVESVEARKEQIKPIDYFRPAQLEELREGCKTLRDRAMIEVLRSTGARVGEIVPINRSQVDWQTGDITILGEKGGRYRVIMLDEVARYHLKKYIDSRTDSSEALFVGNRAPFSRLQKTGIRAAMKEIASRVEMQCRVYPHKMRKTLGMQLKNQGVDLGNIQEILGHTSPAVTSRFYAQSTPDTLRNVRRMAG